MDSSNNFGRLWDIAVVSSYWVPGLGVIESRVIGFWTTGTGKKEVNRNIDSR